MVGACRGLNKQPPHHALCKRYMWPSKQWYCQQYCAAPTQFKQKRDLAGSPPLAFQQGRRQLAPPRRRCMCRHGSVLHAPLACQLGLREVG